MVNQRLLHIVRILLKQNDYITIHNLSNELNVSYKTTSNDLRKLDSYLTEFNLELVKKTGVGIKISGNNEVKLNVYHAISQKSKKNIDYSPKSRMLYIGITLLLNSTCRIHELADELFVSRATIYNDIIALASILESYKIKLIRKNNTGVTITGSEKNYRNCLIELMKMDNGYNVFYEMVKNTNYQCDGSFPFPALDVNDDEFIEFLKILENLNSSYLHTLLFDSLVQVLHHIFVSFIRIRNNYPIHLSEEFIRELQFQPYYEDVHSICKAIEHHYHVQYSEMEIHYLQVFFLSLKNTNEIWVNDRVEAQEIATSLVVKWGEVLPISLTDEYELIHSLFIHFCSALTRYKHGIVIENQLIDDIKLNYPQIFTIVRNSIHLIEEKFHCKISEEEIGFLTLHLALALEKRKKRLRALLICHEGVGVQNLLLKKLQSEFPNMLLIKATQNYPIIDAEHVEEMDIVISTIKLPLEATIPILEINPLLSQQDLLRLRERLTLFYEKKNRFLLQLEKQ